MSKQPPPAPIASTAGRCCTITKLAPALEVYPPPSHHRPPTTADDIHKYFFIVFQIKVRLDISCEFSARKRNHMRHQALFSPKDKSIKKIKCRLLQILFGALKLRTMFGYTQWDSKVTCIINIARSILNLKLEL